MPDRPKRFKESLDRPSLSKDGQAIVREAQDQLASWIDENIDRLESEWRSEFEALKREAAAELASVQDEMGRAKESMLQVLTQLSILQEDWRTGDGATVEQAVTATREAIEGVVSTLEERERRLKGLLREAVSAGLKGVGSS